MKENPAVGLNTVNWRRKERELTGGKVMKKAVVFILVAALSLTVLAVVSGCGGDPNKEDAKAFMVEGDRHMTTVDEKTEELMTVQADLTKTAMGGDTSSLTGEAGAAIQAQVEGILDDTESALMSAQAEYKKITALDGVQDYKDYANKMLEAIAVGMEQLGYTRTLVSNLVAQLGSMAAAGNIDLNALMGLMESEEFTKIEELGEKAAELRDEAEKIKLDKKLEQ